MEYSSPIDNAPLTSAGAANADDPEHQLKMTNVFYLVTFISFGVLCFIFYNTGYAWLGKIIKTLLKSKFQIGTSLVARTTSSMAIWFLLHSIFTFGNRSLEGGFQFLFHSKFKILHFIVLLALWVGFWFIPDGFFDIYLKISMAISCVYMVLQILFLVDFFMELNEKYSPKTDTDSIWGLLIVTIVFAILTLVGFGLCYWMFPDNKTETIAFTTVNLIISIVLFVGAMVVEHGSIFTASLIVLYIAYLTWAALMCEKNSSSKGAGIAYSILASMFTLAWSGYAAFATSNQFQDCQSENSTKPPFSLSFFHILFAMASVYLTMIVTHWGQTEEAASWTTARGTIAKWSNLASSWVVALLYFWTLIAPKVCPNRDFS